MDDTILQQKKYTGTGWLLSILFHVVLGVCFVIITVDMSPLIPEFAEVTFSRLVSAESPSVTQEQTVPRAAQPLPGVTQRQESRLVDIPKRRMTEAEQETIPLDIMDKVQAQETSQPTTARIDPMNRITRESVMTREGTVPGERLQPGLQRIDVGQKTISPVPSEGVVGDITFDIPYEISWEGGAREVLAEILPAFPDDVAKEVVLIFRIEVLPDGTVKEIIPVKKGEATLENLTKQSLKQWLFNPLENSAPQESQFGTITFRFILK